MRILLTGAAGYIASWLRPELERAGHDVTGTDLPEDLLEPGLPLGLIDAHEPDLVVHLAAGIGRERCEADWSATVRNNVEVTVQVARACSRRGVDMLHVSTSEVYGPTLHPAGPDTALHPINLYGLTKKWAEEAARFYAGAGIARLSMPYGPGSLPGSGRCAVHNFLWDAYHGKTITVHRGTHRSWCWAGDTARGLRLMIEQDPRATMNIGRADSLMLSEDVAELAQAVAADLGGQEPVPLNVVTPPEGLTPVKDYRFDELDQLGWAPTVDLDEGMAAYLDWLLRQ